MTIEQIKTAAYAVGIIFDNELIEERRVLPFERIANYLEKYLLSEEDTAAFLYEFFGQMVSEVESFVEMVKRGGAFGLQNFFVMCVYRHMVNCYAQEKTKAMMCGTYNAKTFSKDFYCDYARQFSPEKLLLPECQITDVKAARQLP